jgi:DNA-binding LacI/PurR family transcriptional regulator
VDGFANTARFEALQREGVPIVMIDRYYPSVATAAVVPDHLAAGYQLTEFLIQQGHRYIGTIWSEVACSSVHERLIGYKQALREYHLPIEANLAVLRSYTKLSQEQRHGLLSSWLGAPYRPTAIIAANGTVLGTVVPDLLSLGVRLGEDIILGAMDNADLGIPHALGAATITLPSYEIGREAMRLLLERLKGGKVVAQHIVLPIRLSTPSLVVNSHAVSM